MSASSSLVSIIVPCYNYGWVLSETLESLQSQLHQNWECFIVDDGSEDATREVAQAYVARDPRFQYFYQKNQGVAAARNLALRQIKGEFVQFLDGDDLLAPAKLAIQTAFLAEHPEVDIVYGDVRYFAHGSPQEFMRSFELTDETWAVPMRGKGQAVLERFIERNQLVINAPLLRTSLLNRVGLFSSELRSMEDWDFWVRCALAGAYFYYDESPETWSLVRVHPASLSQNKPRMLLYMTRVREQLEKQLVAMGAEQAVAHNRTELNAAREYSAVYNVRSGNLGIGLRLFWQTARSTGRYTYYLRSAVYWWRNRQYSHQ